MGKYIAQKFVASSPRAEIIGMALTMFLTNLRAEDIRPYLAPYGLDTIDPNKWYPQQLILDFERALVEQKINASEDMVAIGMKSIDTVPVDPNVHTLEDAIMALESILQSTHRNIPAEEGFRVAVSQPGLMVVISNSPYPEDAIYAYLWATAKRYRPARASFSVKAVDNQFTSNFPGTAYEIKWG